MSLRIFALVYMACFAASSMGLYLVKYSVQNIQRDVAEVKTELAAERESLHLLNAEWAYLNRPERLQQLAERHLDLVPLDSRRIENTALLPAASRSDDAAPSASYQPISQVEEAH